MPATQDTNPTFEYRSLEACVTELERADRVGDEVRRFYAVEEIAAFALHSEVPQIRTRADAALKKSADKAKRARKGLSEAFRLKAASRSPALPAICILSVDPDGELEVREL